MNKFYKVIGLDGKSNTIHNSKCNKLDIIEINVKDSPLLHPITGSRLIMVYKTTMIWRIK